MKFLRDDEYNLNPVKCPKSRLPEDQRKKIGITGMDSLDRDDWRSLNKTLDRVLFKFQDPIIVTMGKPNSSVDRLVQKYAHRNWLVTRVHHPQKGKPPVVALETRLIEFLDDCDLLLVFQEDGCEKTEYIITMAAVQLLPVKVITV